MLKDDHHCPFCEYDLTGMYAAWTQSSPLIARCSECGNTFDVGRLRNSKYWAVGLPVRKIPSVVKILLVPFMVLFAIMLISFLIGLLQAMF